MTAQDTHGRGDVLRKTGWPRATAEAEEGELVHNDTKYSERPEQV